MKWSAKIGRFAGIDVYIHVTFLALLGYFAVVFWNESHSYAAVATGLGLVLALFVCVLLHEYGHALTARRFGIRTRHITLLPIGGVALLESMPKDPKREILVALAGPAVNLVLAALGVGLLWVLPAGPEAPGMGGLDVLEALVAANLTLALFNLIPAFPMDGGRVLRAALALRMDRVRATRIAANLGRVCAAGLAVWGLMGNPILILIAAFVWIGGGAEAAAMEASTRLARRPAGRAMITDFATLAPGDALGRAIDLTLAGSQKDFPVVEAGRVVGVLTQGDLLRALRDQGAEAPVVGARRPAATADAATPLADLLERLQGGEARLVCVLSGGRLAGIVDLDNIAEFLRIQSALGRD